MTMAPFVPRLAMAHGPTITTWDYHRQDDKHDIAEKSSAATTTVSFQPHGPSTFISDLAWTGHVVATCATASLYEKNVVLTSSDGSIEFLRMAHGAKSKSKMSSVEEGPTCCAFGGKSRYLCLGDASASLYLWDLKRHCCKRRFQTRSSPCLQVSLDATDRTFLLALSQEGLDVFRLQQGDKAVSITPTVDSTFSAFATIPSDPSHVVLGTQHGLLQLWDMITPQQSPWSSPRPMIHSWRPHQGPNATISGAAGSKTHRVLVATSCLNGTVAFSDCLAGKTIQHMQVGEPVTCLSLQAKGNLCAVGTEKGLVQVYDLRRLVSPLYTWRNNTGNAITAISMSPSSSEPTTTATLSSSEASASQPGIETKKSATSSSPSRPSVATTASEEEPSDPPSGRDAASSSAAGTAIDSNAGRDELDTLRDDLERAIRNVHVDMLRQFHAQSEQIDRAISTQTAVMCQLVEENERLRKENEQLRRRFLV